ncbi:MAG: SPOR domain-containing protein [Gammaproteobacteria bacterium]|nr:SPOR domain-containing protein [Gammaproteobacteria bacterium]MCP4088892.1 SPOR domain-containing protein [Gammaproteobacteria bacterium]MCP4274908.1 SPOR domain-containing protein [Gammaproteobacteria bacterium]MCP4832025.1 SPOR domain-containing protein [Gammaproteobacteria bacterium]MCP4929460.1 SPOR domain-containing protein [Gammaproteobacteria bacterium]
MDRALLERMVGAVVLVLLFVVFVPALLDGRQDDNEGRADASGSRVGTRTEVIVLNASKPAAPPVVEAVKLQVKAAPKKISSQPVKPVAAPKPRQQAPRDGFAVQLGSFTSRDNAMGFASSISEAEYPVFVKRAAASSGAVFRVYAGPRTTREEADKLAARLVADGQSVMVVDLSGAGGG